MSTNHESYRSIDLAVNLGFLSSTQAELLKEEMAMFPMVGDIVPFLLRKGLLTPEQGKALTEEEKKQRELPPNTGLPPEIDLSPRPKPAGTPPSGMNSGMFRQPDLQPQSPSAQPRTPMPTQTQSPTPTWSPVTPTAPPPGAPASISTPTPTPPPSAEPPPKRSIAEALNASRQAMNLPTRSASSPGLTAAGKVGDVPGSSRSTPTFSVSPPTGASARSSTGISPATQIRDLFKMGRDRGCSDLHLTVGKSPYLRQQGKLFFMPELPLTAETARTLIHSVLTPAQQQILEEERQLDFSFEVPGLGRYRANVYYQRLGLEGAFRFIPQEVPTLESLGMPEVLQKLTTYPQGLNLVTGPGGCGKTTTVAAMLEHINTHRHEHIITVEDPVEYVLQPKACQVTQREVGTHTNSFADALRTALRQDPDVIMIGELRDLETTSIAITAAETGHLVFGTLHTSGAVRTVARILDVYPPAQRQQICMMVAESLRGIISQQLLPRTDGPGRVCAMEILVVTTGVSQVIKEGKTHQLISHMQSGRKLGMKSMDDALMELVQAKQISGSIAYAYAENKPAFETIRNQK